MFDHGGVSVVFLILALLFPVAPDHLHPCQKPTKQVLMFWILVFPASVKKRKKSQE